MIQFQKSLIKLFQFLGNLFEYLLEKNDATLNILGATSGDTGSAAIYGVRGRKRIHIFILHPHNRISPVQEKQMTTVTDSNVFNIAIEGTFVATYDPEAYFNAVKDAPVYDISPQGAKLDAIIETLGRKLD